MNIFKYISAGIITVGISLLMTAAVSAQTQGVVTGNSVNVRDTGSLEESTVLYRVDSGTAVEVIDREGDFYRVSLQSDENVYIATDYIKIIHIDGYTLEDTVWLYPYPDDSGENPPVGLLSINEPVSVSASCREWYYITANGVTGYVHKNEIFVPSFAALPEAAAPRIPNASADQLADEIIEFAKELLGTKYVYGSTNPDKGFDCSGFVTYVMKQFDITLNRSSSGMASNGVAVDRSELQKGDLIFFATSGGSKISHVGMYIGNGQFIHSSSQGGSVIITDLSHQYYDTRYVKATRVI